MACAHGDALVISEILRAFLYNTPLVIRHYRKTLFHPRFGAILWILAAQALLQVRVWAADAVRVRMVTDAGEILIGVDTTRAPLTSANFLRYVDEGFYNGGQFHRSVRMDNQPQNQVKIEVIQASVAVARAKEQHPPIALERTRKTGLRHQDGTVSMARGGPDTAQSDFFICIGDQPSLDFGGARNPDGQGFAAFGRVVQGLDIVRKIQQAPVQAQKLTPPVRILKVERAS